MASNRLIETTAHHLTVAHDHGPDGNLIAGAGQARLFQRQPHENLVTRARHVTHIDSLTDPNSAHSATGFATMPSGGTMTGGQSASPV